MMDAGSPEATTRADPGRPGSARERTDLDGSARAPTPEPGTDGDDLADSRELNALVAMCAEGLALLEGPSPLESRLVWANAAFRRMVPLAPVLLRARTLAELPATVALADPSLGPVIDTLVEAARWGDAHTARPNGTVLASRVRPIGMPGEQGARWALLTSEESSGAMGDEALRASERRFRALAANAPVGVFFSEVGLRLGYVNDRFSEQVAQPREALLGMGWLSSIHPDDLPDLLAALDRVLTGTAFDLFARIERGTDGRQRWVRIRGAPVQLPGHGAAFVGSMEDVTDARDHQEALERQATQDPLTGLPNRALLWRRLHQMLEAQPGDAADGVEEGREIALLFFDLDDFKLINDTLGHAAGDQLLMTIAKRLTDGVRPNDTVARLGGDEFVVLCQVHADPALAAPEATTIADRLQRSLGAPLVINGTDVMVSASVGVVVADAGHTAESLLRDADVAMYQAKQSGKARFAVFDEQVRTRMADRLSLVVDLRRALDRHELTVAYQPIWDLRGRLPRAVSIEALVRWNHAERGMVPANQIIHLAEEHGLIDELGEQVLRRACGDLAGLRRDLGPRAPRHVSVNLCTSQLRTASLIELITDALGQSGLSGRDLCLELTETIVLDDIERSAAVLRELRHLGVSLSIDDFGTGYSSLAYLQRLPVQEVKIDRSFVGRLGERSSAGTSGRAIVTAIVAMAHALGLSAVAEGVERPEQLEMLRELGCQLAQGFLLSRPVPVERLPDVLVIPARFAAGRPAVEAS